MNFKKFHPPNYRDRKLGFIKPQFQSVSSQIVQHYGTNLIVAFALQTYWISIHINFQGFQVCGMCYFNQEPPWTYSVRLRAQALSGQRETEAKAARKTEVHWQEWKEDAHRGRGRGAELCMLTGRRACVGSRLQELEQQGIQRKRKWDAWQPQAQKQKSAYL